MVRLTRIYTRTGDDGSTGLIGPARVSKSDPRIEAIGAVDEANAAIGLACASMDGNAEIAASLRRVQNDLFDLGADLAAAEDRPGALRIAASQVERLEQEIDTANARLAPLNSFVLPGGSEGAARLHLARTIVRRAECRVTALRERDAELNSHALSYLNRLSDLLFVLARAANDDGAADVLWIPGAGHIV
jgi:cob(I)alamin adenosyltransferase